MSAINQRLRRGKKNDRIAEVKRRDDSVKNPVAKFEPKPWRRRKLVLGLL